MRSLRQHALSTIVVMTACAGTVHAQNILTNPNFDAATPFSGWTAFDNCFADSGVALSAPNSAKAFGNGSGPFNASGIFQEKPITAGSTWKASVSVYNLSTDAIAGLNFAVMNVIWFNSSNAPISTDSLRIADVTTPTNQWLSRDFTVIAPAGAVKAQYILLHLQESTAGGAVYFDNAGFEPQAAVANQLLNPSFETLGGGAPGNKFTNWTDFNNTFVQDQDPRTGLRAAKCFGNFGGDVASGVFQEVPATPGEQFTASVWVRNRSDDAIQADNFAALNIEWFNAANVQISFDTTTIANASTPVDQWLFRTANYTAPAGTVKARYVLLHIQPGLAPGSVQFDDAALVRVTASCYADCDGSGGLSPADFTCFLGKYRAGTLPAADCDGSGGLSPADFTCFLGKYRAGCP